MNEQNEPNWKDIAEHLAKDVMWALKYLKVPGSGLIVDMRSQQYIHWRDRFINDLEKLPGVELDREGLHALDLPKKEQAKFFKNRKKEATQP